MLVDQSNHSAMFTGINSFIQQQGTGRIKNGIIGTGSSYIIVALVQQPSGNLQICISALQIG